MSIDESEIRDYLEGKKSKVEITLSDNSNDYDKGSDSSNAKIGQKNLDQEKRLARMQYIQERDKKIQFGDKQAIAEYMIEQTEIRRRLEQQKERSLAEYHLRQEEKSRLAKESNITDLDRQEEAEDIQKLENKRDSEVNNLLDYFNCPEKEWQEYLNDNHRPEESPANVLIGTGTVGGFVCKLHRYRDGACSGYTISPIERHFKEYEPEMHKAAIIESINEKYSKLIEARKEKTLQDKDVTFKKELRDIDSIKTRVGSDPIYAATKLIKGQKARLKEAETAQNEQNKKRYGGLY